MKQEIEKFCTYLRDDRHMAANTLISYERDLYRLDMYLQEQGIDDVTKVTSTVLNSYLLYLEKEGKSTATISRAVASIKGFFSYVRELDIVSSNPSRGLHPPRINRREPVRVDGEDVKVLLDQTLGLSAKMVRDRAMLMLLFTTGIQISQLVALKMDDINTSIGYVVCRDKRGERAVSFNLETKDALLVYLGSSREALLRGATSDSLFINCNGSSLSRQGFWKTIKTYAKKAGIENEVTLQSLKLSSAG